VSGKAGVEFFMSGSVNKVILVGNVGKDPDIRRLNSGEPVASFSVATSESWRDKASGERRERTEWHNVVVFNENLVKVIEQYVKKGAKIYLEGQLQTRDYTDKDGNQRKTTEVVLQRYRGELTLLDSRGRGDGDQVGYGSGSGSAAPRVSSAPARPAAGALDDDIPF
jgi:single-strand DNA-binding protein